MKWLFGTLTVAAMGLVLVSGCDKPDQPENFSDYDKAVDGVPRPAPMINSGVLNPPRTASATPSAYEAPVPAAMPAAVTVQPTYPEPYNPAAEEMTGAPAGVEPEDFAEWASPAPPEPVNDAGFDQDGPPPGWEPPGTRPPPGWGEPQDAPAAPEAPASEGENTENGPPPGWEPPGTRPPPGWGEEEPEAPSFFGPNQ